LLGLEFVYARDQPALDAYLAGRIGDREFRRRVRYREEWGYAWPPLRDLLACARRWGVRVRGLDLPPRGGRAELATRDRVAAIRLVHELSGTNPGRAVVLFGEAHLAASHLPRQLQRRFGSARRTLRIFHDLEREDLPRPGWYASGARTLIKQSALAKSRADSLARVYRAWAEETVPEGEIDLPLVVHSLITTQAHFARLDPRRVRIAPARWLADVLPEVYALRESARVTRRLAEVGVSRASARRWLDEAKHRGSLYLPGANLMLAGSGLRALALEGGRFLSLSLRPSRGGEGVWSSLVVDALAYGFGQAVDPGLGARAIRSSGDRGVFSRCRAAQLGREIGSALRSGVLSPRRFHRWLKADLSDERASRRLVQVMQRALVALR